MFGVKLYQVNRDKGITEGLEGIEGEIN
jgi:hypothetical protein